MSRKVVPKEYEERGREYREAVAPYLGREEIEAVGAFERPLRLWEGLTGWMFGGFTKKEDGRLGDIPEYFLVAVTKDTVHTFNRQDRRSDGVEGRVAEFPARTSVFTRRSGTSESPASCLN